MAVGLCKIVMCIKKKQIKEKEVKETGVGGEKEDTIREDNKK